MPITVHGKTGPFEEFDTRDETSANLNSVVRFASKKQVLVLDEADRILDLGFRDQLNSVLEYLPPSRQSMLFSATQTKSVKDLARLSLRKVCGRMLLLASGMETVSR